MELIIQLEKDHHLLKHNFSGQTVQDLLQELKLNSETVLIIRNNEVLTEEELLQDQDQLEILSVVSGG